MTLSPTRILSIVLAVGAAACGPTAAPREATGVNVLLISLDSTRRDMLSAYGRSSKYAPDRPTTPNIDALARDGVLFEDAYSTTSWTLPSHMSIFTGLPELVHAVELDPQRLSASVMTFPEILSRAGYRTAGFYSGPYLDPRHGFGRGFDTYSACYGNALAAATKRAAELRRRLEEGDVGSAQEARELQRRLGETEVEIEAGSHRDVSSANVTEGALQALEEMASAQEPFFVFAHYFDPHYDYVPPPPHDTAFDPDYSGTVDGKDFYWSPRISLFDESSSDQRRVRRINDRDLEHVFSLYDGELEWTDVQVGRLLHKLEELGLADDTLVIVTSDHGDEFFEHGAIGHRRTLYEEVVQVPLILTLPSVLPAGKRITGPTSTIAILPTALELLGLPEPPRLVGQSLMPRIREGAQHTEGVFGRFVGHTRFDAEGTVGSQIKVVETYRRGSIKITREHTWMHVPDEAPESIKKRIATRNQTLLGESLRWIDLDASPGERTLDASRDFSVPRAREVLAEFHDRYLELMEQRVRSESLDAESTNLSMLKALGYADGAAEPVSALDEVVRLPAPGRAILGRD